MKESLDASAICRVTHVLAEAWDLYDCSTPVGPAELVFGAPGKVIGIRFEERKMTDVRPQDTI